MNLSACRNMYEKFICFNISTNSCVETFLFLRMYVSMYPIYQKYSIENELQNGRFARYC